MHAETASTLRGRHGVDAARERAEGASMHSLAGSAPDLSDPARFNFARLFG
jgi:hypothetical protein